MNQRRRLTTAALACATILAFGSSARSQTIIYDSGCYSPPTYCPPIYYPPTYCPPYCPPVIIEEPAPVPPPEEIPTPEPEPECPCEGEPFSYEDDDTQGVTVDAGTTVTDLANTLSTGYTVSSADAVFAVIKALVMQQVRDFLRTVPGLPANWENTIAGIIDSQLATIEAAVNNAIAAAKADMKATVTDAANSVINELNDSDAEFSGTFNTVGCDKTGMWSIDETTFTVPSASKHKEKGIRMKPKIKLKLDALIAGLEVEVQIEFIVTFKADVEGTLTSVGTTGPTPADQPTTEVGVKPLLTLSGDGTLHVELGGVLAEGKSKTVTKKQDTVTGTLSVTLPEDPCCEEETPEPEELPAPSDSSTSVDIFAPIETSSTSEPSYN